MLTHCGSSAQFTVVVGAAVVEVVTTVVSVVPVPVVVVVVQVLQKVGQMLTTNEERQSTHVAEAHEGAVVAPAVVAPAVVPPAVVAALVVDPGAAVVPPDMVVAENGLCFNI